MSEKLFTSESVTEGHPDKVCDQIADALLDSYLATDATSRCAIEVCATTDYVMVFGEVTSNAKVNVEKVVREVVSDIGYNDGALGFDSKTCKIHIALKTQSTDIALGVDSATDCTSDDELDK